jgi:RNA polymerase sigma-70 factor (ECF subfamily)
MSALLGVPRTARRPSETAVELYEAHGRRVFTFCLGRLRNTEEAQDAAQTTFMYVVKSLRRGVVPRNELAWLLTIADNVCRSTRRANGRRSLHVVPTDVTELEAAAVSMSPETNADIEALRNALTVLPPRQQRAILLREWQGLSYADIADELGVSPGAVETLLFRARKTLAAQLDGSRPALRVVNVASTVSLLRSVLGSGTAKIAAAAAGAALVIGPGVDLVKPSTVDASVPIVELALPANDPSAVTKPAPTVPLRSLPAGPRRVATDLSSAAMATRAGRLVRPTALEPTPPTAQPVVSASTTASPAVPSPTAQPAPQPAVQSGSLAPVVADVSETVDQVETTATAAVQTVTGSVSGALPLPGR